MHLETLLRLPAPILAPLHFVSSLLPKFGTLKNHVLSAQTASFSKNSTFQASRSIPTSRNGRSPTRFFYKVFIWHFETGWYVAKRTSTVNSARHTLTVEPSKCTASATYSHLNCLPLSSYQNDLRSLTTPPARILPTWHYFHNFMVMTPKQTFVRVVLKFRKIGRFHVLPTRFDATLT